MIIITSSTIYIIHNTLSSNSFENHYHQQIYWRTIFHQVFTNVYNVYSILFYDDSMYIVQVATTVTVVTTACVWPYAPKMLYKLAKIHMNELAICHFDIICEGNLKVHTCTEKRRKEEKKTEIENVTLQTMNKMIETIQCLAIFKWILRNYVCLCVCVCSMIHRSHYL